MREFADHLRRAWAEVGGDYNSGLINSERCLQASFYRALRAEFDAAWRVFVEPKLSFENGESFLPDLVICRGRTIEAFVEIKFVPNLYPKWQGDIQKFRTLALQDQSEFPVERNPNNGRASDPPVRMTDQTKFVFAVIGNQHAEAVYRSEIDLGNMSPSRFFHAVGIVPADGLVVFKLEQ